MNQKPFGRTIRQEVISAASNKLRVWKAQGQAATASDAIEAVIDGAKVGTLGRSMKDYVVGISGLAYTRLENEIERTAK